MQLPLEMNKLFQTSRIISGAMLLAVLVYAVIVEVMRRQFDPFQGFAAPRTAQLPDIFYGLALMALVAIRVLRKTLLKSNPGDDGKILVRKLVVAHIVTYCLCEIPAILGLVLFLMGGHYREFYVLLLFSLLLMVLYFPKIDHWEAWLRKSMSSGQGLRS